MKREQVEPLRRAKGRGDTARNAARVFPSLERVVKTLRTKEKAFFRSAVPRNEEPHVYKYYRSREYIWTGGKIILHVIK